MDAGMASQAVTFTVIAQLRERYGGLYSERNVALSGTHTHSGPSGYLQHLVYGVLSLGFYKPTFDVLVDGVVQVLLLGCCCFYFVFCFFFFGGGGGGGRAVSGYPPTPPKQKP